MCEINTWCEFICIVFSAYTCDVLSNVGEATCTPPWWSKTPCFKPEAMLPSRWCYYACVCCVQPVHTFFRCNSLRYASDCAIRMELSDDIKSSRDVTDSCSSTLITAGTPFIVRLPQVVHIGVPTGNFDRICELPTFKCGEEVGAEISGMRPVFWRSTAIIRRVYRLGTMVKKVSRENWFQPQRMLKNMPRQKKKLVAVKALYMARSVV